MNDSARFLPETITFEYDTFGLAGGADVIVRAPVVVSGEFRFGDGAVSSFDLQLTPEERDALDVILEGVKQRALERLRTMTAA